jgi:hypothetical protein
MRLLSRKRKKELLSRVVYEQLDIGDLCDTMHLSLPELATWAGERATLESLQSLRVLADLRTQLIVSRYRAHAAARLIELTGNAATEETMRKACVDLLKVAITPWRDEVAETEPATPDDLGERLLSALDALGETLADDAPASDGPPSDAKEGDAA